MQGTEQWLLVWILAVVLNVVPAFMPPTWALLAYFHLDRGLDSLTLALVGAAGSTTGRALLAKLSHAFGARFIPARWRANITALAAVLQEKPALGLSTLLLYTLGPAPSNHLFIAAGLASVPLTPILAVFAVTRFVSYLVWVSVASTAATSLRDVLGPRLGNELTIAVQIAGFLVLILVMQIDWATWLRRWRIASPAASERPDDSRHGSC